MASAYYRIFLETNNILAKYKNIWQLKSTPVGYLIPKKKVKGKIKYFKAELK